MNVYMECVLQDTGLNKALPNSFDYAYNAYYMYSFLCYTQLLLHVVVLFSLNYVDKENNQGEWSKGIKGI